MIGASLTLAPVVYVALERLIFVKVGAVATFAGLALVFAVKADSWRALPAGLSGVEGMPLELGFALLFGAIAFAGAGGGQNLCQSNWIRDKGFGMGAYVPRLVSPLTGVEEAAPTAVSGYIFETDTRQHGALAPLVVVRQHRAAPDVHARQHRDHLPDLDDRALHAVRHARTCRTAPRSSASKASGCRRSSAPGSACSSGGSARSRCSRPRWGSPTTPAAWPPTC